MSMSVLPAHVPVYYMHASVLEEFPRRSARALDHLSACFNDV